MRDTHQVGIAMGCSTGVSSQSPNAVDGRAVCGDADRMVSTRHDRRRLPTEMLGFAKGSTVSGVTVAEFPIVHTSGDHGTAFDIAGRGIADGRSPPDAVAVTRETANRCVETPAKTGGEA